MLFVILLALLTDLPWMQSHLTYPINYCNMAHVCIHDSRTVCASTPDGCSRRSFLDQCDMYEYNCDYGTLFEKISCHKINEEGGSESECEHTRIAQKFSGERKYDDDCIELVTPQCPEIYTKDVFSSTTIITGPSQRTKNTVDTTRYKIHNDITNSEVVESSVEIFSSEIESGIGTNSKLPIIKEILTRRVTNPKILTSSLFTSILHRSSEKTKTVITKTTTQLTKEPRIIKMRVKETTEFKWWYPSPCNSKRCRVPSTWLTTLARRYHRG